MKGILLIVVVLVVIGGGVFAMMRMGIPPFSKPHGATKRSAIMRPTPVVSSAPTTMEPHAAADAGTTPVSSLSARVAVPSHQRVAEEPPDPEAERRLSRIASVYEQMPADDAGKILVKLPDPLVEKLLGRMDERQVGKLLLTFDANRAARLTQALAR